MISNIALVSIRVYAIGVSLKRIITAKEVVLDVVFGSVAVYLLFGIVMAMGFQLVDTLNPGTVIESVTAEVTGRGGDFTEFLYFSFVTLTSVGYGDLSPLEDTARSLAMFEGVMGQLYMAILVARLVGIHIAQE